MQQLAPLKFCKSAPRVPRQFDCKLRSSVMFCCTQDETPFDAIILFHPEGHPDISLQREAKWFLAPYRSGPEGERGDLPQLFSEQVQGRPPVACCGFCNPLKGMGLSPRRIPNLGYFPSDCPLKQSPHWHYYPTGRRALLWGIRRISLLLVKRKGSMPCSVVSCAAWEPADGCCQEADIQVKDS